MKEEVKKRIEKVHEYHEKGYNCAQSILCAYADKVGMEEETLFKISEGFGLGMGGMNASCGAVSAGVVLTGLQTSTGNLENPNSKAKTYQIGKAMTDDFLQKNGTLVCKELKGIETKKVVRSCDGCMEDMVAIIEKYL